MNAIAVSLPDASPARRLEAGVLALVFAVGVLLLPWEAWQGFAFVDLEVYLETFQPTHESMRDIYELDSILDFISYEILWDDFVRVLVRITGDPRLALSLISAFVLWINACVLYRRYGYILPTVMLLSPLFIDFALSQLRLAFAISLLLAALNIRARAPALALVICAPFIHTSTPLFVGLFGLVKYVERRGQEWSWQRIVFIAGGICLVLIVGLSFGRDALLIAMGDRRANVYADSYNSSSLMYVSFWAGLLFMQLVAGRDYLRRPDNLYAAMSLMLFVGLTLTGTYGSRFGAAAFPLVIAATLNLPPENRNIVLPVFIVFQLVQFLYWFGFVY